MRIGADPGVDRRPRQQTLRGAFHVALASSCHPAGYPTAYFVCGAGLLRRGACRRLDSGDAVKALCQSATLFAAAAEAAGPNDVLRRLSLVTVQLELGWRGAALTTLEKVIRRIDRLPDPASEPFLVPIAHYADMTPNDPRSWLHALLRATWQRVAVFSSWHAQRDSLANLDAFLLTGINDPWMQRAHTLLRVLAEGDSQAYDPRTWPHDKTEPFDMLPRWPGWLRGRLPAA